MATSETSDFVEDEESPRRSGTPINRRRVWVNVVLQLTFLFALVLIANYLSFRHYERWDLTRNHRFTLSETTTGYLESLRDDVKFIVAFASASPIADDVRGLVEEYERRSGGRIQVEMIDPVREPDRAAEITSRYQLVLNTNSVLIARGEDVRVVTERDMVEVDEKQDIITSFFGEIALTRGLISVVEEEPHRVYVVQGHHNAEFLTAVKEELASQGARYHVEVAFHSLTQPVPEDADALVLAAPQNDLNADEMHQLVTWWGRKRAALLVTLDPAARTPLLDMFIRRHGIQARDDRILLAGRVAGQQLQKVYSVPAMIRPGSVITRSLGGLVFTLEGRSQSLALIEKDGVKDANVHLTPLLVADHRFWGETEYESEEVRRDRNQDYHAPLYLAAMVERGAVDDPNLRVETQRMVVVSNPTLLEGGEARQKVKSDFALAALNWLMDRTELIGVTPREPTRYVVEMSAEERNLLERLIFYVFPGIALFIGGLIWVSRRG